MFSPSCVGFFLNVQTCKISHCFEDILAVNVFYVHVSTAIFTLKTSFCAKSGNMMVDRRLCLSPSEHTCVSMILCVTFPVTKREC